jgi:alkanesulfonate monooxygenase SsuD/methylene tetrahydromethanopterin reductase-like flavin-dependent oxidoreductase (luciferase family)
MAVDVLIDPFGAHWRDVRRLAEAIEGNGFDGIWMWDHLAGICHRQPHVLECWTVLSGLAACTSTVKLGPLVLNVANRDAGTLAVMAATLDDVTEGRLLLGLGAGGGASTPYAKEQRALGRAVDGDRARRAAVASTCETIRRVWADHSNGFLAPSPPVPLVVGGFGPVMADLAGTYADGFNTQAFSPQLEALVTRSRRAHDASSRAGQPFLVTVFAGMDRRWLDPNRTERNALHRCGVDRLIVICDASASNRDIERAAALRDGAG